jgi:hypothetical protein
LACGEETRQRDDELKKMIVPARYDKRRNQAQNANGREC